MSYGDGEALILARIRLMAQFDPQNSSRAKWGILNSGAAAQYAILRAAPFTNDYDGLGHGHVRTSWRTVVELWQRWVDDGPTAVALQTLAQATLEHLERYPSLAGEGLLAWVSGGGEMQQRWLKEGGPVWAVWEVYIDWQEERFISVAE